LTLNPRFELVGQASQRLEEAAKGSSPAPATPSAGAKQPAKPQGSQGGKSAN